MSEPNLSSIPLPSGDDAPQKSLSSAKKSAKEMLKEALKDHTGVQRKDSIQTMRKTSAVEAARQETTSSQNIVDKLFNDFITRKMSPASVCSSSSIAVERGKDSVNVGSMTSVDEISQLLDLEIKSIQSNSGSANVASRKLEEKQDNPETSASAKTIAHEVNQSSKIPNPKSSQSSGDQVNSQKLVSVNDVRSGSDNPKGSSSSNSTGETSDAVVAPQTVLPSCHVEEKKEKTQPVSESKRLETPTADQGDKSCGKSLSMLPLPLAKKAAKPKLLDLKLSQQSLSLLKEKETASSESKQWEEGEVVSSNSEDSDRNDTNSDGDGELPSDAGSVNSSTEEKKAHSSKHKKKHKHKKKKKKKSTKSKERSRGERRLDKSRDSAEKSSRLSSSEVTGTVFSDSLSDKESKDTRESGERKRKRKSSSEVGKEGNKSDSCRSHEDRQKETTPQKQRTDGKRTLSRDEFEDEKKKEKKRRKKSRSRSRSPKRSKHSSSRSKSSSKTSGTRNDDYDQWDAYKYKEDSRKWKTGHSDRTKDGQRGREDRDRDLRVRIDKARLRKIAIANALQNMKTGHGPEISISTRAGGKSVEELTDFCKKISEKEKNKNDSDISESDEEEAEENEDDSLIHHPFKLKDNSSNIVLNIRNARQLPVLTPSEKQAQQAALRLTFPVSSGSHHRATESEWVPVQPKAAPSETVAPATPSKNTATVDKPVVEPPKSEPSIFPTAESKIDIGSIISERLQAVRKLQENPFDVQALSKMHQVQEQANKWASSQHLPGQFLGSTGAQVLSQEQLLGDRRHQAWAKKSQFLQAAPVNGGIGMFLLQKMGWKLGEGLGKNNEGNKEPLMLDIKIDRKGLQASTETQKGRNCQPQQPRAKDLSNKHPVSALMELCNKRRWGPPAFTVVSESGPDHKKNFLFKVKVNSVEYQPAVASSNKKSAKAQCAAVCLQEMGLLPRDVPLLF